jgi:hypothetical protein
VAFARTSGPLAEGDVSGNGDADCKSDDDESARLYHKVERRTSDADYVGEPVWA